MEEKLQNILENKYHYSKYASIITSKDLLNINKNLLGILTDFIDKNIITDIICESYSIKELMDKYDFNFFNALLIINWLMNDYLEADKALRRELWI